jgi:hypothetical protein
MKNDPTSTKSKQKIEDELLALQGLVPANYDKSPEEIAQQQALMQQEQAQGRQTPQPVI